MFQIIVVAINWRLAINEVCLGFSTMEASHTYWNPFRRLRLHFFLYFISLWKALRGATYWRVETPYIDVDSSNATMWLRKLPNIRAEITLQDFMETLWTFPKARKFKVRPPAREVGEKLIWSLDNVDAPPKKWTDDIFTAVDLFQCHEVASLKCLSWLWSGCHRMNCTKNEPRSVFPSQFRFLFIFLSSPKE